MIASPFPPCSSSPTTPNTNSLPQIHWVSPPPSPFPAAVTSFKIKNLLSVVHAIANNRISSPELTVNTTAAAGQKFNSDDHNLLTLLRQRKTDEAWEAYTQSAQLPNPTCLSRLVCQLSHRNTPESLSRAQSILTRLRHERQLHRLDANSLGLLAVTAAKAGQTLYATSVINSMLRSGYLPHVKAWSAVVSRLAAAGDDGPATAIKLFTTITTRIRSFPDPAGAIDSKPDTAAYNAALNACANLGDRKQFRQLFDEMPEFGLEPDVLTFNIMIKLCARANRKDLLVSVLEMILMKGIDPCITTLHSLVAAFVGFGDLETAEKVVQAMREGRRDFCKILRDSNIDENSDNKEEEEEDTYEEEEDPDEVFDKLLLPSNQNAPLFPKPFYPDTRIYTTLMKGYMKFGRVADMVRMLDAMQNQENSSSHPDHVSYTTVVSALVRGGSMDQAREVLSEMGRVRVPANRITYNILLRGYCNQLQMDKAKELFDEMIGKKIEPDVISYNTIIDGCILGDDSASALKYFNEMRARSIAPTKVSYTTLMKAFAMSGQPKIAHKVFDEMSQDPRIKVDLVAWNMLVKGYSRLGLVEEVKRVIEKMKDNGFSPDVATYGSLVNAIAIARKPGEALLLWNEIKESGFEPDEGILEGLADICVRAALFKKALEIVACMEENGIAPNKTKYKKIYVEMHSRMFTSKHASQARVARRSERKRAAEAFKFWLGLPNSYYASEWHFGDEDD